MPGAGGPLSLPAQAVEQQVQARAELFDVVVQHSVNAVAQAVPFDADDLPAYAGALFDYLLAHSGHLRLAAWAQFERPQPSLSEVDAYRAKIDAIVDVRRRMPRPEPRNRVLVSQRIP